MQLKEYFGSLLNIIYPKTCLVCHSRLENNTVDNSLCTNCRQEIKKNIPPFCVICGRQIRGNQIYKNVCPNCLRRNFCFDRALSPCVYEGVIRELIHKFKYQNKGYLNRLLTGFLIEFIRQNRITTQLFDLVMPIPLHQTRLREREFNQAELLARRIAQEFCLVLSSSNLWQKHHRKTQMELKKTQRWENIKDSFALRNPSQVKGKNILLIDDVLTTGATCSEASSTLKAAGAEIVWVLTLAN